MGLEAALKGYGSQHLAEFPSHAFGSSPSLPRRQPCSGRVALDGPLVEYYLGTSKVPLRENNFEYFLCSVST